MLVKKSEGENLMILPDILAEGLRVVFCGTAVGDVSAKRGAYYAGPGNRFWSILQETGLTPRKLEPEEFGELLSHHIGLTDLTKKVSGSDSVIGVGHFDISGFERKIKLAHRRVVAFNGKRAAQIYFGKPVTYGYQLRLIGRSAVFVLPSTSGAARGYWQADYWQELERFLRFKK